MGLIQQESKADGSGIAAFRQCRHGAMIFLKRDRYIGRSLNLYGEWSEAEAETFARYVHAGDTVIEAGANVGAHTVLLAKLVGQQGTIYAFEPQRVIFQLLCANLALNDLFNVRAYHGALGRQRATIKVPATDYSAEANFGGISLIASGAGEDVPLCTIDSMGIEKLNLLKIDVEGMEAEVIAGAAQTIRKLRPVLYVENDRRDKSRELIRMIMRLGYDMWWHLPPIYNPGNFAGNANNVFGGIMSVNLLCLPKERPEDIKNLRRVSSPDDSWENHPAGSLPVRNLKPDQPPAGASVIAETLKQALSLYQRDSFGDAEALYREVLALAPHNFDALHMLGVCHHRNGDNRSAEELIRRAIAGNLNHAGAHVNLGLVLKAQRRLNEALASFDRASQLNPDFAEAFNNRGNVLINLGRLPEALASYERALDIKPDYAEAHYNRGNVLQRSKRLEEAIASYDRAIELKLDFAEAFNNRGSALLDLKRPEQALLNFERVLQLNPNSAEAVNNRGHALLEMRRPGEALACFDRALELKPDYVQALNNRGNALAELNRIEEALASFDRALEIRPDFPEVLNNRAGTLREFKRLDEGIADFDRALQLKPDYAKARYSRGMIKLLTGRYAEGWTDYESRCDDESLAGIRARFRAPTWHGENLAGRRLAIHSEQGLGDIIQFARYLPRVARLPAKVTLVASPRLARLLRPLTCGIETTASTENLESFDFECGLMSLPLRFGTDIASIPADIPYLTAEPDLVPKWRERIGAKGFKIGIAWQGSPVNRIDRGRSVPLVEFAPLSQIPGVRLISLQKTHGLDQLGAMPAGMTVELFRDPFDAGPDAFIDTAAIMMNLDLIITSDTSIAHLAGALGRPAWVALKHVPDWRWLLDREDSPWYPTMRLFRQKTSGDWRSVFSRMREALKSRHTNQKS